ncbi:MAG: thiamine pyrophosphate-dependent dehydrogenase E1 component subunit alpha [Deltaproteobacteria bacterium]|nr:thiamine pyrophosphate-dependent dehydrogenase E1 component subunit alpha [Deltaproteobacteria bacterium]
MPRLYSDDRNIDLYYALKLVRGFEDKVSVLHRQNKILGGVYSGRGQEAIVVGTVYDLGPEDWVFPIHRDLGVWLVRHTDPNKLMAQLMARKGGLSKGKDNWTHAGDADRNVFGATSMLGGTQPVACGVAWRFKLRGEPHVTVSYFGEGASSRGDVHEAMNFAGVHNLACVFVCENNQYAYSTPVNMEIAGGSVSDRASGYGFPGVKCNGNDLHEMLEVTREAVERAKAGRGPTLIEAVTYRIKGHSEHDRADYRTKDEVALWESKDPVVTWELFLEKLGVDLPKLRADVESKVKEVCDKAAEFALASPYPEGPEAMEDLYASPIGARG